MSDGTRVIGSTYRLDRSVRLTDGLLIASLLTMGGGGDQVLNAAMPAYYATITPGTNASPWQRGADGFGYVSDGTNYASFYAAGIFSPAPNPYTAAVRCQMAPLTQNAENFGKMWGAWNGTTTPYQNWGIFQNGGVIGVSMGNTNGPIDLLLDELQIGSVHTIAQTWDGGTLYGYVDGVLMNQVGITPTTGMVTGTPAIGMCVGNSNEFWPAPTYAVFLWNRCLSAGAIAQFSRNPYALFSRQPFPMTAVSITPPQAPVANFPPLMGPPAPIGIGTVVQRL